MTMTQFVLKGRSKSQGLRHWLSAFLKEELGLVDTLHLAFAKKEQGENSKADAKCGSAPSGGTDGHSIILPQKLQLGAAQ